ncbi:Ubiquitin fusion degradation protein 4, partial [Linderina macrospora]
MAEEKGDGDQVMEERSGDGDNKTQDWHLVFKLKTEDDERVVSSEENIFRVVSSMCQQSEALRTANPWAQVFTLQFHVEFGQDKSDDAASIAEQRAQLESPDLQQLGEMFGHQCAVIIELIKQLHDHLPQAVRILHQKRLVSEDSELFINRKVAAKATRQLDDPLHVVCGAIPRWCHQLVHYAPFLVPFDTRLAYLQATSFGYSRNISRWQTLAQREARSGSSRTSDLQIPLGRIQRQKVRISRHRMLESALKVMDLYGTAKTILEVEYFQEVGTGLGPTLEFYATVSRSLRDKSLELWRDPTGAAAPAAATNADDKPADPEYIDSRLGLFPRAINPELAGSPSETQDGSEAGRALSPTERAAQLFKFLGHFVAKGLIDGRILDLPLHEEFWAAVQRYSVDSNAETDLAWSWAQLEHVDPAQTKSLQYLQRFVDQRTEIYQRDGLTAEQKMVQAEAIRDPKTGASVDDLSLDFTLPGYPEIEMREGGSSIPVTINNLPVYIDQVAQWTLGKGIQRQVRAFCDGFNKIFSVRDLSIFAPAELSRLVGPSSDSEDWSMATLLSTIKADHGFSLASPAVKMFLDFMESLDSTGRRRFLRFVTGSPQLPFGGFRALHPPLTL